jgi:hypothetical protein
MRDKQGPNWAEVSLNNFSTAQMPLIWAEFRATLAGYFDDEEQESLGDSKPLSPPRSPYLWQSFARMTF